MSISSKLHSLLFSSLIAFLYPASLYIWPNALNRVRDDPGTIKRNFISVTICLIISFKSLSVYKQWCDNFTSSSNSIFDYINIKSYPNWWEFFFKCTLLPLITVAILFLGPICFEIQQLYQSLPSCDYQLFRIKRILKLYFCQLYNCCYDTIILRNLLISPITEELLYRGILHSILIPFWPTALAVLISSTLFGSMHLHYFVRSGNWCQTELLHALIKCTYTTLFGMYASIEYIESGNIITPILLHTFCNWNGLPDFQMLFSKKRYYYLTLAGFIIWCFHLIHLSLYWFELFKPKRRNPILQIVLLDFSCRLLLLLINWNVDL